MREGSLTYEGMGAYPAHEIAYHRKSADDFENRAVILHDWVTSTTKHVIEQIRWIRTR